MNRYAVCIVTYNSEKEISACLKSVLAHTPDCEICVVDNASTDNTAMILEKFPVSRVLNDKNVGYSVAMNQAIRWTQAEYVIMLNPDTVVKPLWAERMAAHFSKKNVGAVGPLSTNCMVYQSVTAYYPDLTDVCEKVLMNAGSYSHHDLIMGFCMMVRRSTLNRVGYLDETLFLGNDDLELCWRLRCYGYQCVVARDAYIEHEMQRSFNSLPSSQKEALAKQSSDALYRKLHKYFDGKVPSSVDIWGVDIYKPSKEVIDELS